MLANLIVAIIWVGVLAYAIFGGADFGSGFWDLLAGSDRRGAAIRKQIDKSIGPVWEANHVWLIFIIVFLWTGFPDAFAALMTGLFLPFVGVAAGIVFRGGAFVFRKSSVSLAQAKFFGILFAVSSVITPFFLGAAIGAVASGRVSVDRVNDPITSWLAPTPILGGILAVGTCAWLSAVFMARDAARTSNFVMADYFAARALITGVVIGAVSLGGIFVLRSDAPTLADQLQTRGLPLILVSAAAGLATMVLLRRERYTDARIPAIIAVASVILGWGVGQYPWLLVDQIKIEEAAAPDNVMVALLITFGLAAVLAVPALVLLLRLTETGALSSSDTRPDSSQAVLDRIK